MNYGFIPSKKDIRDYKINKALSASADFPKEYQLDHGRIKNQGNVSSCVAHAMSSALECYTDNTIDLSTNFIYGIRKKLVDSVTLGMTIGDACKIVQKYGDMLEQDCPGNYEMTKCFTTAEEDFKDIEKVATAKVFKIESYYSCETVEDIKTALMAGHMVIVGVNWYRYTLDSNFIIHFDTSHYSGGHALLIYGWNEHGFLFQNSWGESFGDKGCAVLPFNIDFIEARALVDYENDVQVYIKPSKFKFIKVVYTIINFLLNLFSSKRV